MMTSSVKSTMDHVKAMHRANLLTADPLPSHTFFEPTESFWTSIRIWQEQHNIQFTECGCGMGTLIGKAEQRGLRIKGVDISHRVGQHKEVERKDATTLSWSEKHWPLICRPDHSGWCEDVIRKAQGQGAWSIYIGLPSNYFRDIGMFRTRRQAGPPVGKAGERMYLVAPRN
jgi:hypothetical protein